MAYAAVISVLLTIKRLRDSKRVSITSSLNLANDEVESLRRILVSSDNFSSTKRMDELDGEMREAVSKLEDELESPLYDHLLSQSEESIGDLLSSDNFSSTKRMDELYGEMREDVPKLEDELESLSQSEESIGDERCSMICLSIDEEEIRFLLERVKYLKKGYVAELQRPLPEEDDYAVPSRCVDVRGITSNIFGLSSDEMSRMKQQIKEKRPYGLQIIAVIAERGTSRTMFGKLLCEEASRNSFDICGLVRVGKEYELKDILMGILSQVDDDYQGYGSDHQRLVEKWISERLYTCLKGSKYLIVLEDIWEVGVWNLLRSFFPRENNGCRVIITTSLMEVAQSAADFYYELKIQIEDQGWDLIRHLESSSYPEWDAEKIAKIQRLMSQGDDEMYGEDITKYDDDYVFSATDSVETIANMFKLYDCVWDDILFGDYVGNHNIIGVFGMAGIGKTTLARQIFDDPCISQTFNFRVWITMGPNYQSKNIFADILAQIVPDMDKTLIMKGDEMLLELLSMSCGQTCLIVLDDIWSKHHLDVVRKLFHKLTCEILLITRLKFVSELGHEVYKMRLLNKEESWHFLCENVFGKQFCHAELEKPGKVIAEECEGLPLMISTIASLLSKADKTPEYWNKVAEKQNSVFQEAYDIISEMLYPTYEYLPNFLKTLFLYMGVFPLKHKIPSSKLFKLLSFEGILDDHVWNLEKYVTELVSRSLLLEGKMSSSFRIKTSSLHSVYWHLCVKEARKNKFYHVLNKSSDGLEEYITGQRRFCIQNNILFGMKDVYNSIKSNSTARSLLCTGPIHQYPVPICLGSRLLRVLDALTVRFYEFPIKVVHLVLLRFFGLTYDGMLPPSISKLGNLECLIVRRHLNTKVCGAPSYLPKQIWDMKELKHLQVMGSDLPDPCGAVLPNLVTLLDISAESVIGGVLRGTPNLKELGIRIELTPDASEPMFNFDDLDHLKSLESLKCSVVNPELIGPGVVASYPPPGHVEDLASQNYVDMNPVSILDPLDSTFIASYFNHIGFVKTQMLNFALPKNLVKLSLSGFGYPWEYMGTLGRELWFLRVLKLRCYAFRGPEWVIHEGEFEQLRYLLLEDTDLEYLTLKTNNERFYSLRRLIIRHCYKLKKFPWATNDGKLEVEVVDCSTSASNLSSWLKSMVHGKHASQTFGMIGTLQQELDSKW